MILTFVIGLILIRQLLGVGQGAYAVYALVVAGFGFSILLREMLRVSMIGQLNKVLYESAHETEAVKKVLAEISRMALVGAVLAAVIMAGIAIALPSFGIEGDDLFWAQMFVVLRAVYVLAAVMIYPTLLLVLAQGRQVFLNVILLTERALELTALLITISIGIGGGTAFLSLFVFGALTSGGVLLFYTGLYRFVMPDQPLFSATDPLRTLWARHRSNLWNGVRDIAGPMLFFRFDLVFLSALFGQPAILMMSLGIQLMGYILQSCMGLVSGLEAVFGKVWFRTAGSDTSNTKVRTALIWQVSSLQATVLLFICGFLITHLEVLLALWLDDRLDGAVFSLPELYTLVCVFLPGMIATGFSQSWTTMLTGAGRLGDFVGYILGFSMLNPILVVAITYALGLDAWRALMLAAALYSILKVACYGFVLPIIIGRILGIRFGHLYRPALVPGIGAVLTTLVGLILPGGLLVHIGCYLAGFLMTLRALRYDPAYRRNISYAADP